MNTPKSIVQKLSVSLLSLLLAGGGTLEAATGTLSVQVTTGSSWNYLLDTGTNSGAANYETIRTALETVNTELKKQTDRNIRMVFPSGTYCIYSATSPCMTLNLPMTMTAGDSLSIEGVFNANYSQGDPFDPANIDQYGTYGALETTLILQNFEQGGILVNTSPRLTIKNLHLRRPDTVDFPGYPGSPGIFTSEGVVTGVGTGTDGFPTITVSVYPGFPNPTIFMDDPSGDGQERVLIPFREQDKLNPQLDPTAPSFRVRSIASAGGNSYIFSTQFGLPVGNRLLNRPVALKGRTGQNTIRIANSDQCTLQRLLITRFSGCPIRSEGTTSGLNVDRVRIDRPAEIFGSGTNQRRPFLSGADGAIQLVCGEDGPTVQNCIIRGMADDPIGIFSHYGSTDITKLSSGVKILNNFICDTSNRGMLITQTDGLNSSGGAYTGSGTTPIPNVVSGNTFIRTGYWALALRMGKVYASGTGTVRDWTIENNTFKQQCGQAVIALAREYSGTGGVKTFCPGGIEKNIQILNNTFENAPKTNPIIFLDKTGNIEISDNTIASYSSEIWYDDSGAQVSEEVDIGPVNSSDSPYYYPGNSQALIFESDMSTGNTHGDGNRDLGNDLTRHPSLFADTDGPLNVLWTKAIFSQPTEDGYVKGIPFGLDGDSMAPAGTNPRAGDQNTNAEFQGFVSFNAAPLIPISASGTAVVVSASLRLTQSGTSGDTSNLDPCTADVKKGSGFGGNPALSKTDFQASADVMDAVTLVNTGGIWSGTVAPSHIEMGTGASNRTQFRIHYGPATDGDGVADFTAWYSGTNSAAVRPALDVNYK